VHRLGELQAELIRIEGDQAIPMHTHPGVDSIDLIIAGDIDLIVGGRCIAEGHSRERRAALLKSFGIRIAQDAPHAGRTSIDGILYVSCQRWRTTPSHIPLSWVGAPCTDAHQRLLDAFAKVA
jgi:hypothetical protein